MKGPIKALACTILLAGCASPPLRYYTLGAPGVSTPSGSAAPQTPIVELDRVSLPDYVDTQDITTRNGERILRSPNSRWADRLSVGATALLAARLSQAWPGFLVTAQENDLDAADRLAISIARLDVTTGGQGALEASWRLIPHDPHLPVRQGRASIAVTGTARDDAETVALTRQLIEQLAARVAVEAP